MNDGTRRWAAALACALGTATGCENAIEDEEQLADDEQELRIIPTPTPIPLFWNPKTYTRLQCNDPEGEYTRPPTNGYCDIEVQLVETSFASGQGASEGRGELSFDVGATPMTGPGGTTTRSGSEATYTPGEDKDAKGSLGTYRVPVGTTRDIEICADFTEHDNGGANGGDDVASTCETITLSCVPGSGQETFDELIGPATLCGDNTCNGSASALVRVMRADADGDGIQNDDDFTPEPCDELNKGLAGRAVLLYFHYEDNEFTTFFQSAFTDLSQVYPAYDYVVLVADNDSSNANNTAGEAFRLADRVYPPTRDGLLEAMRHLTDEGYNFDWFGHAHGYKIGDDDDPSGFVPDDSKFEVLTGNSITGNWLESATDPNKIGTARGGVPILAHWSTTCIAQRHADAFIRVGAKAANGAIEVQFFPNEWGPFVDRWVGGDMYGTAVADARTLQTMDEAFLLVGAQGMLPPFLCIEDTVLEQNECADDFFTDTLGPNDAEYNIQAIYDPSLTGIENMILSSARAMYGNPTITFDGTGQIWP